jgi:hypothetical protein
VSGLNLERVRRRIQSLMFGITDMRCVEVTAEHLLDADPMAGAPEALVNRTLEAGLIIVYARPFTASRGLPRLAPAPFETEHLRRVHQAYLDHRRRVYAHTDETNFRVILELADPDWLDQFVAKGPRLYETWSPPTPDLLEDVRALAVANRESFEAELEPTPATENELASSARSRTGTRLTVTSSAPGR